MKHKKRVLSIRNGLNQLFSNYPAWLRKELRLVPVRQTWAKLPFHIRAGASPIGIKGKILIIGVDGAPRRIELSFQKARLISFFAKQGLIFEDIKFKPIPQDSLPSSHLPEPQQKPIDIQKQDKNLDPKQEEKLNTIKTIISNFLNKHKGEDND